MFYKFTFLYVGKCYYGERERADNCGKQPNRYARPSVQAHIHRRRFRLIKSFKPEEVSRKLEAILGAPERKHFGYRLKALKDFGYRLFILMQIDATYGQLICYFCEGGGDA